MYPQFKLYQDARKQWRWTFSAANGEAVAVSSESYKNKADAEAAIALVNGVAAVEIVTDEKVIEGKLKQARKPRKVLRKRRK